MNFQKEFDIFSIIYYHFYLDIWFFIDIYVYIEKKCLISDSQIGKGGEKNEEDRLERRALPVTGRSVTGEMIDLVPGIGFFVVQGAAAWSRHSAVRRALSSALRQRGRDDVEKTQTLWPCAQSRTKVRTKLPTRQQDEKRRVS